MMVAFVVPGEPVAKGRARAFIRGGHVAHYTPEKTARFENLVKLAAQQAMNGEPISGPVALYCTFVLPVPASTSKKRTAACLATAMKRCAGSWDCVPTANSIWRILSSIILLWSFIRIPSVQRMPNLSAWKTLSARWTIQRQALWIRKTALF